jgi:tetratricopeptide (TPR) repeat protein
MIAKIPRDAARARDGAGVRCQEKACGAPLPVTVPQGFVLAMARFPENPFQCLLHLLGKPSEIVCGVCGHRNDVLDVVAIMNQKTGASVLYVAERNRDNARLSAELQAILGENGDPSACVVAKDGREFRRAFATLFLEPYMKTFNEGSGSDDLRIWAHANTHRLDPGFMAAMWLLLNHALPMGAQRRDELVETTSPQRFFYPTAENEAMFSPEMGDLARTSIVQFVSELLTYRIIDIAVELGDAPDLMRALPALTEATSALLLADATDAVSELFTQMVPSLDLSDPQRFAAEYVLEALHALLYYVHKIENPRRAEWSQRVALFEAAQPADAKREGMLLPADIIRATVDKGLFLGQLSRGLVSVGKLGAESMALIQCLARPLQQVFPSEVATFIQPRLDRSKHKADFDEILSDEFLDAEFDRVASQGLPMAAAVYSILNLASNFPDRLPILSDRLWHRIHTRENSIEDRLSAANHIIETLNLSRNYRAALDFAVSRVLPETKSLSGPSPQYASFLNELGSCYRYAGRFEEALTQYETSLRVFPGKPYSRDERGVRRNMAIVLRSMGQLTQARAILAELRAHSDFTEQFGLALTEALCWSQEGRSDKALETLETVSDAFVGAPLNDQNVRCYAFVLAQFLRRAERYDEAVRKFDTVRIAAQQAGDHYFEIVADAEIYLCRKKTSGEEDSHARARIVEGLLRIHEHPGEFQADTSATAAIADLLLRLLDKDKRYAEGEQIIRTAIQRSVKNPTVAWHLCLRAAEFADKRGDRDQATEDLAEALNYLKLAIHSTDPSGDPFALLSDLRSQIVSLTTYLFNYVALGQLSSTTLWIAADLQTSPILSRQFSDLIAGGTGETAHHAERVEGLIHATDSALVQTVETDDGFSLLITDLAGDHAEIWLIHSTYRPATCGA